MTTPDSLSPSAAPNPNYSPQREIEMWKGYLDEAEAKLKVAYAEIDRLSASPLSDTPAPTLEQRFRLKEAIVRLRGMGGEHRGVWLPATLPLDIGAVLDEIDRLMLINGQIAKLWAEAEDRAALPSSPPDTPGVSDFSDLLYEYAHCVVSNYFAVTAKMPDVEQREADVNAARRSLEDYFRTLQRENERLKRFETYVCQVIAMGNQADLTVESLPR